MSLGIGILHSTYVSYCSRPCTEWDEGLRANFHRLQAELAPRHTRKRKHKFVRVEGRCFLFQDFQM